MVLLIDSYFESNSGLIRLTDNLTAQILAANPPIYQTSHITIPQKALHFLIFFLKMPILRIYLSF